MGTHPIFESDFDCLTDEMSEKLESKESEDSLESNLDDEWEAVCASVIADGVVLIKEDGSYADGYLDHVVDGHESEDSSLKKKRSRRENDSEWNNNVLPNQIFNAKPTRKRRSARIDEIFSTSGQKLPQALGFLPGTPTSVMSAKKSIKSPPDILPPKKAKIVHTISSKPVSINPSRIGGLSNMCLDDRLNLRKVKMDQKGKMTNKAQISRTILNCMRTGQTIAVETELDRRLPDIPALTSRPIKKKAEIELELFEI